MNKPNTTQWDVTMKCRVTVPGTTSTDFEKHLDSLGFTNVEISAYELVDEHRDLPLVRFSYRKSDVDDFQNPSVRWVRVTEVTDKLVKGYENGQFKSFRVDRITSAVNLESFTPNAK